MARENDAITIFFDPQYGSDEESDGLRYVLEMVPGGRWSVWRESKGYREPTSLENQAPTEVFRGFVDLVELEVGDGMYDGMMKEVAFQDWDSDGPGAGAGRVSVYRLGTPSVGCVYFGVHDAGYTDGFGTLGAACLAAGVDVVTDATVSNWSEDEER